MNLNINAGFHYCCTSSNIHDQVHNNSKKEFTLTFRFATLLKQYENFLKNVLDNETTFWFLVSKQRVNNPLGRRKVFKKENKSGRGFK